MSAIGTAGLKLLVSVDVANYLVLVRQLGAVMSDDEWRFRVSVHSIGLLFTCSVIDNHTRVYNTPCTRFIISIVIISINIIV